MSDIIEKLSPTFNMRHIECPVCHDTLISTILPNGSMYSHAYKCGLNIKTNARALAMYGDSDHTLKSTFERKTDNEDFGLLEIEYCAYPNSIIQLNHKYKLTNTKKTILLDILKEISDMNNNIKKLIDLHLIKE